jgi:hypothetical protein
VRAAGSRFIYRKGRFIDRKIAIDWLKRPNYVLGGVAPLGIVDTELKARVRWRASLVAWIWQCQLTNVPFVEISHLPQQFSMKMEGAGQSQSFGQDTIQIWV